MSTVQPETAGDNPPPVDPKELQQAIRAELDAAESRIHQLAEKTGAEFAFLAFTAVQFSEIAQAEGLLDEGKHGNIPGAVETAAYYLYKHFGKCSETDHSAVAEIIDLIPELYRLNLMASGIGAFADDVALNVVGPSKLHAQAVRGSAWPDQTKAEILGIQGRFDSWFTNRIGLSPSRAIAILESMEEAFEVQVNRERTKVFEDAPDPPESGEDIEKVRAFIQTVMDRMSERLPRAIPLAPDHLSITPPVEQSEWKSLISLIGLSPDAVGSMSGSAEVSQRPVFVTTGERAFYLDQSTVFDALYDAFDLVVRKDQKFYSGKYTKHLSTWLEEQAMSHLGKVFPPESIFANLVYPDPDVPGGEAELDGLILWGPFQILLEAKGRQFRLAGQLHEPGKLRTDLKKNIEEAFDQASRAQRFIDSTASPEFKEKSSGRIAKIKKSGKSFRFVISVSLHHLGPVTAQLAVLKEIGLLGGGQYPWSVCLADLDVISRFSETPDILLHYVKRRVELQESQKRVMADELDLFGNYLDTRLHPSLFWNRKTDTGDEYDFIHIADGSERFKQWKEAELGLRPAAPKIELEVPDEIRGILEELRRRDQDEARWLAVALLDFHPEDLEHLAATMEKQRSISIPPGHRPRISYKNSHDDTAVTVITGVPSESKLIRELTRRRSLLEKYRHRSEKAIGLSIDPSIASPIDLAGYYEFPWEKNGEIEKELADEPLPLLPGAKLPGRNAPCPCGSGKKFKKCCLPRIEAR